MKDRLVLLCLFLAFAFFAVETRYMHAGIASVEPVAWIPVGASALGGLFCLLGMLGGKKLNQVLGFLMILLAGAGGYGFYVHHKGDFSTLDKAITSNLREDRLERALNDGDPADPPPDLAPLGLSGLCLISAITLIVQRKEPRVS